LSNDLNLNVLHVGERFDRQILPCPPAGNRQHNGDREHEDALLQGEGDEPV